MLYPEKETVKKLLKEYRNVPTFYELLMDSYTPVHLFNALHGRYENCFILESVNNKDQWSRYSYIGIEPKQRITLDKHKAYVEELSGEREITDVDDPISFFSALIEKNRAPQFPNRPKLTGGLMGYFSYDVVRYFEKTLGKPPADDLGLPDAELFNYDKLVAYDHLTNKAVIILNINADEDADAKYAECERKAEEIVEVLKSYVPKPAAPKESGRELTVTSNISREQYLKTVIDQVRDEYEFIVLDCPPSLGLLTKNALVVCDELYVPTTPEYTPVAGLVKLQEECEEIAEELNPGLRITGIIITRYNPTKNLNLAADQSLRENFGPVVFNTRIRENIRIAESPQFYKDIISYAPQSNGAKDYLALTEEVLKRLETGHDN